MSYRNKIAVNITAGCLFALLAACSPMSEPADNSTVQEPPANPDPAHNSRISLDWPGVYTGIIPCADCPGIDTSITLLADGTYQRSVQYLERDERPRFDQGRFVWNDAGGTVILMVDDKPEQSYKVGENVLFHLDQDGKVITGGLAANYRLSMMPFDPELQDREWVLVELLGQPVTTERPPTLRFDRATARLSGSDGCNRLMGNYRLREVNRLQIGDNMASTMMACPDMATSKQFNDALQQVDNYSIGNGELSLNRARMAPLLRFRQAATEE